MPRRWDSSEDGHSLQQSGGGLNLVNAEDAVKLWAATMHDTTRKYTNNVNLHYEVNWSRVKIHHTDANFVKDRSEPDIGHVVTMFESAFNNKGKNTHHHKLSAKRSESSCHAKLHHGMLVPLRSVLPMPLHVAAACGSSQLVLENAEVRLQDTLEWQVKNVITVGAGENIQAQMTSTEYNWEGQFEVNTMLRGNVGIAVFSNGKFLYTLQGDIATIFEHAKRSGEKKKFGNIGVDDTARIVTFTTAGVMKFRYHVNHETNVTRPYQYRSKTCCDYFGDICGCFCHFFCGCCCYDC